MSSGVKLEVAGEFHDISDCSWFQVAPCGHTCGAVVAEMFGEVNATPEQAHKAMTENAEVRRREDKQGFRMELGLRSEAMDRMSQCDCEPRWGVVKTPVPVGFTWADISDWPRKSGGRKHIVPSTALARDNYTDRFESLCGRSPWRWEKTWDELPECMKCVKAAHAAAKGSAERGEGEQ